MIVTIIDSRIGYYRVIDLSEFSKDLRNYINFVKDIEILTNIIVYHDMKDSCKDETFLAPSIKYHVPDSFTF